MKRAAGDAGATLLEVLFATAILAVGLVGLGAVLYKAGEVSRATREQVLAYNALRDVVERLRAEAVEDVYARYNARPDDDPAGAGTAPGHEFDVEGLRPPPGRRVGRFSFPEVDGVLREDAEGWDLPPGRDLNGDGRSDAGDRSNDYRLLPVKVEVAWTEGRLSAQVFLTRK